MPPPHAQPPPAPESRRPRMRPEVALDLAVYGVLLAGLSLLGHYLNLKLANATFITGWLGGGLGILWAVAGWRGIRCHWAAIATIGIVTGVLAAQIVQSWGTAARGLWLDRMSVALMLILAVVGLAILVRLWPGKHGHIYD